MGSDEAHIIHLTPGVVHNFPKAVSLQVYILSPMHKKITDSYSKREGGNPRISGLLPQQKMVHYPRMFGRNTLLNTK